MKRHPLLMIIASLVLLSSLSGYAQTPQTADDLGKIIFKALQSVPFAEANQYVQKEAAGGASGLSAWYWYEVEANKMAPAQVENAYIQAIGKNLSASGLSIGNLAPPLEKLGNRVISFQSPDGKLSATLSVAARETSDKKILIVVAGAISPPQK